MLQQLLDLLPELRVVVLFGDKAAQAWSRAHVSWTGPVLTTWHTSPLALNNVKSRRGEIIQTLRRARELAEIS
jgi:uracil-DNA glycosylase